MTLTTTYPGDSTYPGGSLYPLSGGSFLFTPPTWRMTFRIERSLRDSFEVAKTVYKDADGVWQAKEVPYDGDLAAAQRVLTSGGPVVVDQTTADELTAAGIGTITQE